MRKDIYRHLFVDLPTHIWMPLWKRTLEYKNECPLTSTPVVRSTGTPTVRVRYSINGELNERDFPVLFNENSPSLSSESSEAYGACICIKGTGELTILSIE